MQNWTITNNDGGRVERRRGRGEGRVLLEVPDAATQSVMSVGGVSPIVLKELAKDCGSRSPNYGVQDCGCGGGARGRSRGARGGVNGDPACCIGGP
jgi:hypothetical protein